MSWRPKGLAGKDPTGMVRPPRPSLPQSDQLAHTPAVLPDVIAPPVVRPAAGAGRILPLGLGGQPEGLVGHLGQPRGIGLGPVPADVDYGPPSTSPVLVIRQLEEIRIQLEGRVLVEGHLVSAHPEGPDGDRMLRALPTFAIGCAVVRPLFFSLRHSNLSTTQRYLGPISDTEAIRWIENLYG
jgi:hypothetical protein